MKYNYIKNEVEDVKEYIKENINLEDYTREELEEKLYEDLWIEDSVTGNASGSYTFNTWEAEEYLCHNMDLLKEALDEFGYGTGARYGESNNEYTTAYVLADKGAEWCDVTIRCYLLRSAISQALDEVM